jgi:competence protein ComEC
VEASADEDPKEPVPLAFVAAAAMFVSALATGEIVDRGVGSQAGMDDVRRGAVSSFAVSAATVAVLSLAVLGCCGKARWGVLATRRWIMLLSAAAGVALTLAEARVVASRGPPRDGPCLVRGTVRSEPRVGDGGGDALAAFAIHEASRTFRFDVEAVRSTDGEPWAPRPFEAIVRVSGLDPIPGRSARVEVRGWCRTPRTIRNPGARDGLPLPVIDVPSSGLLQPLEDRWPWDAALRWLRSAAADGIARSMPAWARDSDHALVSAMTTGIRLPGLSRPASDFRAAGMSHVLAISGFNVAVLVTVVASVGRVAGASATMRALAAIGVAAAFLAIVEPETSVLRAGLGAGLAAAASVRGGAARGLGTLGLVAIASMAIDIDVVRDAGFQLSYGVVVALLVLTSPACARWSSRLTQWIRPSHPRHELARHAADAAAAAMVSAVVAWTVSTPIALAHAGTASGWAAPLSVATMPLAALTTICGVCAAVVSPISGPANATFGMAAAACARALDEVAIASLDLPGAIWWTGRPAAWWTIATLVATVLAWRARSAALRRVSWAIAAVLAGLLWFGPARPHGLDRGSGSLVVSTLDVGEGACHMVTCGDTTVLLDAGSMSDGNAGSRRIVPALAALGIRRIDAILLTDRTRARVSALPEVLRAYPVDRLMVPSIVLDHLSDRDGAGAALAACLDAHGMRPEVMRAGDRRTIGDMRIDILWPDDIAVPDRRQDGCLAARIAPTDAPASSCAFLACGSLDVESAIDSVADRSGVTAVVDLPGHGADREASRLLVERTIPDMAIQSCAARRVGKDVWGNLLGPARHACTAIDGAVQVRVSPAGGVETLAWTGRGWRQRSRSSARSSTTTSPTKLPSAGSSRTSKGPSGRSMRTSRRRSPGANRCRSSSPPAARITRSTVPAALARRGRTAVATSRRAPPAAG